MYQVIYYRRGGSMCLSGSRGKSVGILRQDFYFLQVSKSESSNLCTDDPACIEVTSEWQSY